MTADPLKDVALRAGEAASSCQRDCANFSVTRKRAELSQWPSAFCLEKNPVHSPFYRSGKVFFVHPVRAVQRGCCWEKDWNRWGRRENCDGEITENYWRAREDRLLLPSAVFIELFPPCQKQTRLLTCTQTNTGSDSLHQQMLVQVQSRVSWAESDRTI